MSNQWREGSNTHFMFVYGSGGSGISGYIIRGDGDGGNWRYLKVDGWSRGRQESGEMRNDELLIVKNSQESGFCIDGSVLDLKHA